jgi:hypothetical protein
VGRIPTEERRDIVRTCRCPQRAFQDTESDGAVPASEECRTLGLSSADAYAGPR